MKPRRLGIVIRSANKVTMLAIALTFLLFQSSTALASPILPSVSLPPNWVLVPGKSDEITGAHYRYKLNPAFDVSVGQNTKNPGRATLGVPYECDFLLGSLQSIGKGKVATLEARPDYFPDDFYARVLLPKGQESELLVACLYLGASNIVVQIRPTPKSEEGSIIGPLLRAVVQSVKSQSTLTYAPAKVNLPRLAATVVLSQGIWTLGSVSVPQLGILDLLVRTGGTAELKVVPFLKPVNCSTELKVPGNALNAESSTAPQLRMKPQYVSAHWEPAAIESRPGHEAGERLQSLICRQLTSKAALMVSISYGDPEISGMDARSVAGSLDEIADAVLRTLKPDGPPNVAAPLRH